MQQRTLGEDALAQRIIEDALRDPTSLHDVASVLQQCTHWWQAVIAAVIRKNPALAGQVGPLAGYHPGKPLRGGMSAADSMRTFPVHYAHSPMQAEWRKTVVLQGDTKESCDACKEGGPSRIANLMIGGMTTMQAHLCKCVLDSPKPFDAQNALIAHGKMIDAGPRSPQKGGPMHVLHGWGSMPEAEFVQLQEERAARYAPPVTSGFTFALPGVLKRAFRLPETSVVGAEKHA